ncbi:50S ribosomal protein L24 [Lyticum sinuosum]|uniref:Large ribosomal subunit protein uL24 n=1 Tax=Lyticum sinuosum TaxID=1332059 RepID=A0AAE5AHU3_9RICK|nr:50S ribosomal protein L24 [Lyticum sinuosum]MDZ5761179.1 50S ribosomal protein L24 [Lyticum sinuosum]
MTSVVRKIKTKRKIRKGDKVIVISGNHKGKTGIVKEVISFPAFFSKKKIKYDYKVCIEGVNVIKKRKAKQGGSKREFEHVMEESGIHISNVAMLDPKVGKPSRVGYKYDSTGNKYRVCLLSGEAVPPPFM